MVSPLYRGMPSYTDLVATILTDTLACQDPTSAQSQGRRHGRYAPFGPYILGESGGYPTTDSAMEALAELADKIRDNDPALRLVISRDPMRLLASRVVGELLPELIREPSPAQHWQRIRERLMSRA